MQTSIFIKRIEEEENKMPPVTNYKWECYNNSSAIKDRSVTRYRLELKIEDARNLQELITELEKAAKDIQSARSQ